ncbi:MAG TPA: hypothetical protein VEK07_25310 [Polyangiaceae bacterium]|nr:hypothetical protein [Polyangiaceae bacterium]
MIGLWLSARRIKQVTALVIGVVSASSGRAAWAQEAHEQVTGPAAAAPSNADLAAAKKHYSDAEKKYKSGDFAGALTDFHAANDIKSTPQAERYIGLCEDALGHFAVAVDWYTKFLAHVPPKMSTLGDETHKRVVEISALPGKVHVESTPPGADVVIDGKLQPAPAPFDVEVTPGQHLLEFKQRGRIPASKMIDVAFASAQSAAVDLEAEPAPQPPPAPVAAAPAPVALPAVPPPPQPRSKVPAYVTGALAIAAAGVGTAFGILTLNDKAQFDRNPTTQTADNGDTHSLIADMSFGVAITFAVTSIVLFVTKDEPPASTTSAQPPTRVARTRRTETRSVGWTVAPMVGSRSGGADLVVRF